MARRTSVERPSAEEALNLATAQSENVFLFVPNLIGYTRVILAGVSLHFMSYHPIYCTIAYCISCLLDAVDGQAARALGQTSKFGAVLDMVTDRCTTSCLLCYLASAYPDFALLFQFLIALDFSSHYMHMYSSLVTGSVSHKQVNSDVSNILWWYYNNSTTLFLVCAGNELFFVSLYLMKWISQPIGLAMPSTLVENEPPVEPPIIEASASPPEAPTEEPERVKRKTRLALPTRDPETPVELPEGLDLEILWRPESDAGPSDQSALPPPEIFEEALHNLNITLHPQIQHRATYPSPLGPLVEPTLALYCPIEGGDYVIDATVRELARRINAEVLVLDAVQLAAGEWGVFGKAANALQLPRNPLHFPSNPAGTRASSSAEDQEDDMDSGSPPLTPTQMTLTLLNPQSGRSIVASAARRTAPATKISTFFETVVNTSSSDEQVRPRLVYIRDFPTLSPSSTAWYPSLLSSVRARRRRTLSRTTAPITHPVTIVFGITPPLVPRGVSTAPPPTTTRRTGANNKGGEWSEDPNSDRAREKRLRERLRRWERGEGLQAELLKAAPDIDNAGNGEGNPGVIIIGNSSAMIAHPPGESGNRESSSDPESLFFRTSVVVPGFRSLIEERSCRVKRRREINELTMRMGVGSVGGAIDKDSAGSVFESAGPSASSEESQSPQRQMWEDWGNRVEAWPTVRAVSDRAVGRAVVTSLATEVETERRPMDSTRVTWQDIDNAWATHRASRGLRKMWMKEATKSTSQEQEEDDHSDDEATEPEPVDEIVERVRNDEDLDAHEKQLLSCIVDSATMPTSFRQVHLPSHTIDSVRTIVSLPLLHPQAFQQGILKEHGMTGCLLFGPPGTGKTLVVRALAKEAGCRMLSITPADVLDMYVGEGEKLVKAVFSLARRLAPCVIFLDEIDALFCVLTEFMQEMDGLRSSKEDNVIVIGATNRPFDLDDAVLRRLPRRLLVDLPGEPERAEILNILLRDETLGPDTDTKSIAKKTEGFSGSDLKHLCVSAALDAVKENVVVPWSSTPPTVEDSQHDASSETVPPPSSVPRVLHLRHFTKALKEITPSASEFSGTLSELRNWNQEFGEGRNSSKKRQQVWGRDRFGFTEKMRVPEEHGRVLPSGGSA
ncbi:AAA domain-containing protein [Mycena indigotica]|uniref:CDP-diacylglycerol--inositol 3-phosphatidyltransferase n=1 Tax=Mycena indigotica TaxID=2126181 RepID=A0A8H6VV23_9AGAR|nr:AAA domain-containing protein [Mycena indigotica]KAF7294989.1 AAA domain-containing protein [Mycena indigotica]